MKGLIGDRLDAGRIESGALSVDPEPMEVAAPVEQARTTYLSGGARQAMRLDLPQDLPPVMADERRIVQVLNNLFANAARHSPESAPIHVPTRRAIGLEVAVSVTDEGPGIPPERLPHLFRKYADFERRGRRARARGVRPGPGHLQGAGRGARGTASGPRAPIRASAPASPSRSRCPAKSRRPRFRPSSRGRAQHPSARAPRAASGAGGGRRPGDAALRPRHARGGGLRAARHGRPGGGGRPRSGPASGRSSSCST